jgi:hypothetical protein
MTEGEKPDKSVICQQLYGYVTFPSGLCQQQRCLLAGESYIMSDYFPHVPLSPVLLWFKDESHYLGKILLLMPTDINSLCVLDRPFWTEHEVP